MKTLTKLFSLIAIVASVNNVRADDIRLGTPGYGGNGCPAGTASVTLSPDNKALTLIFDQYSAQAGGFSGRIARKTCNIAIPVHVPQGFSVSIIAVDYRGFNALPYGSQSRFAAEYFFAGSVGPKVQRTFYGPLTQDYLINNNLAVGALVWSACGADVNLRVNTSMTAIANGANEDTLATVDSADFKAGVVYRFSWRQC